MKHLGRVGLVSILIVSFLVVSTSSAFAYIDPGSGSFILQAVVAAFAAIAISIKAFWYRIKTFFAGKSAADPTDPDEEE